jgi:phage FluMu gp28-like protein
MPESTSAESPAIRLYDYQRRWLLDGSRFKIGMFARQTGKTFTTTLEIVDRCLRAAADGRRERWVILSRGERQAREAMREGVQRHAAAFGAAFDALEYDWVGAETTVRALEVALPGGSLVTALPANPDTARGFSASVFLDEFAWHHDSRAIWRALFPVISRPGLLLRITSTPNGRGNVFYELMSSDDPVWSRHRVDIYQAVADGLPRDVEELRRALRDPDAWAQEFELAWLDEASAWLPYELIDRVQHEAAGDPGRYEGGPCYVGVDIAARRDLFVIVVLERVGDVLWLRELFAARRLSFAAQAEELDRVMASYRVDRVCMDQTGMGEMPVEDAQRRHGAYRVEGVLFTAAAQQRLAQLAKRAVEDRLLRLPPDPDLRRDLHALKQAVGASGVPRFVVDGETDGHADRAWALFLALAAAERPAVPIEYRACGATRVAARLSDWRGEETWRRTA